MPYRIEPLEKKSIVDVTTFRKVLPDGTRIFLTQETGYRWGHFIAEDDPRESLEEGEELPDPLCVSDYNEIDHEYTDGCWSDYDVSELSDEEQELLHETTWPEDCGWEAIDGEVYFHGPVQITEI